MKTASIIKERKIVNTLFKHILTGQFLEKKNEEKVMHVHLDYFFLTSEINNYWPCHENPI